MFTPELCQQVLLSITQNVRSDRVRIADEDAAAASSDGTWVSLIGTAGSTRMLALMYTPARHAEVAAMRELDRAKCRDMCPHGHTSPPSRYCPRRAGADGGWTNGRRCSVCVSSRWERIIYALVQMVGLETTKHYIGQTRDAHGRVTWQGHELDIYCPELKKAIEYNGQQHYERGFFTPDITKRLYKDQEKLFTCHRADIQLLFVRYDDPRPVETVLEFLR